MGEVRIKPLPVREELLALLSYDPSTGKLTRKDIPGSGLRYRKRHAGREAFTCKDQRGYLHGRVLGQIYQAHRIIWKMMYGTDPDFIDHINRDPSDNRLENLRSCSVAENSRNSAKKKRGSSEYRGVSWVTRDQVWVAQISVAPLGKIRLGSFRIEEEAARAYDRAAREHHGKFAILNFSHEVTR